MESANVQTGKDLLDKYYNKDMQTVETITEPVRFEKKVKYGSIMV